MWNYFSLCRVYASTNDSVRLLFAIAVSATQAALCVISRPSPDETSCLNFAKLAQTGDIFCPNVAATLTFVCVYEPVMRTAAAAALETPAKRSLASSLLPLDSRSIEGGLAAANAVASASAAVTPAAAAGIVSAGRSGGGPPVGTDAMGAGRCCGEIVWVVGMCGGWAGPPNPEQKRKTNP